MDKKNARGFTLIEISIVLVIIGLIIGGILVGRDLVAAAAARAQITQIERYRSNVNAFFNKYGGLPGDLNATLAAQFGFMARGSSAGQGDGNGLIQGVGSLNRSVTSGETISFWSDLSSAGLIEGNFTYASETSGMSNAESIIIPHYLPEARIGQGNYVYVTSGGVLPTGASSGTGNGTNYFGVEAVNGFGGTLSATLTISPAAAYAIDSKIDDGLPQYGAVIAAFSSSVTGQQAGWSAGSTTTCSVNGYSLTCANAVGDSESTTHAPVTTGDGVTTAASATTCYDNGGAGGIEHYSIGYNGGNGQNCGLWFKMAAGN